MRKLLLICIIALASPVLVSAQDWMPPDTLEDMIIYSHERSGFGMIHSAGIGLGFRAGYSSTIFRTRNLSIELSTLISLKQLKFINPYYANAKRFVYGKLNDVGLLRAGYGFTNLINRKPYWGGVELHWLWEAGPSLAFEKPYYLYVFKVVPASDDEFDYVLDTQKFSDKDTWVEIFGRAPFTKGINELRLVPGAYAKLGLSMEFGAVRTSIKAVETGVIVSWFPQRLHLMDDDNHQMLYLNFYISYSFGTRFNKY
ncbi:MAG: hypothetical protein WCR58_08485 [Bacteroidales bacterium]|jgi:hypothetical protein|nr:hypothetical protein [Bacteroidales bacterium]MCK9449264.1 hypothetical protein [Bacteroidales bacterium]MDD3700233.1 hypothetical protein [Bacteroidales bacterium]MDY0370651.1 hypothetical protein [Bacteroidales bacterium]